MNLYINEIFHSIQGETIKSGYPSLFIRLAGCNLNCRFCDTQYAKDNGYYESVERLIDIASGYGHTDHITITGGEPLNQENSVILMNRLTELGHSVQLETNGSIDVKDVPSSVRKIVDVKTPSSGEESSFFFKNLDYLTENDEIKFVISDINDYNYSKNFIDRYLNGRNIIINFSPAFNMMKYKEIAELILSDRLKVRLNLQLHKIIWPDGEPKFS
jgi:7-carboxy-7-deazaguanine synthase